MLSIGGDFYSTKESYIEFLSLLFTTLDKEERDESIEITNNTIEKFKLLSALIDVLQEYPGSIPESWIKNS